MDNYTISDISGWTEVSKGSYKLRLQEHLNFKTIIEFIDKFTKHQSTLEFHGVSDKPFIYSIQKISGIYRLNGKPVELYEMVKSMMNFAPNVMITHIILTVHK